MASPETVLKKITESLESVKPKIWPDRGFTVPRGGIAESLDKWIRDADARQFRQAVVRFTTLPRYENSLCYYYLTLTIEVAYPASIPEDVKSALILSDSNEISQQITRRPRLWGDADSVYPVGTQVEEYEDDNERVVLSVLSVSFDVILGVGEPPER